MKRLFLLGLMLSGCASTREFKESGIGVWSVEKGKMEYLGSDHTKILVYKDGSLDGILYYTWTDGWVFNKNVKDPVCGH
jgi:hypothetical protein